MEANELRIGNKVQASGHIFTVTVNLMLSPENFEPIPLTEEWLLKFGFKKVLGYGHSINGLSGFIINCVWYRYYDLYIECKYVHQLQNLYFALTGTELTIKE